MAAARIRIDEATLDALNRLSGELNISVGDTVALAVRALRQERLGADLRSPLRADEQAWLNAAAG